MLKNRIIPCLDVSNGRVVKGINFINLKDAGDPVEQAEYYDKCGADEICFLDITATHEKRNTIIDIVNRTAEKCFVPLTVGGGIKSIQNIRDLLLAGADKVSINSAAVNDINFVKEALPEGNKLRFLPNALLMPHVGYVTAENYSMFYTQMIESLEACVNEKPIRIIE